MNAKLSSASRNRPLVDFSHHLNLADPTEHFMAGWIARVHMSPPRLYQVLAMKRAELKKEGRFERLIYELARFTGNPACYTLIIWNIDEVSMRWQDFGRHAEAMAAYRTLG